MSVIDTTLILTVGKFLQKNMIIMTTKNELLESMKTVLELETTQLETFKKLSIGKLTSAYKQILIDGVKILELPEVMVQSASIVRLVNYYSNAKETYIQSGANEAKSGAVGMNPRVLAVNNVFKHFEHLFPLSKQDIKKLVAGQYAFHYFNLGEYKDTPELLTNLTTIIALAKSGEITPLASHKYPSNHASTDALKKNANFVALQIWGRATSTTNMLNNPELFTHTMTEDQNTKLISIQKK